MRFLLRDVFRALPAAENRVRMKLSSRVVVTSPHQTMEGELPMMTETISYREITTLGWIGLAWPSRNE